MKQCKIRLCLGYLHSNYNTKWFLNTRYFKVQFSVIPECKFQAKLRGTEYLNVCCLSFKITHSPNRDCNQLSFNEEY